MALEAATYVSQFVVSNPTGADLQSQGDDHIRLIKAVIQNTFPDLTKAIRFTSLTTVGTSNLTVIAPTDDNTIFPISASGAARTVTAPANGVNLVDGFEFTIIKTDASVNAVTVSAAALINGAASIVLYHQYEAVRLIYNDPDSTWHAVKTGLNYIAPAASSSNVTIDITYFMKLLTISASGGNRTVTLPSGLPAGFWFEIAKGDLTANTVTLDATAGGNINGSATLALDVQYVRHKIIWDGATWSCPVYDGVPAGASMLWWTDTAPTGWALLEGQAISRTTYPRLFTRFGTVYGVGDGSTTFNLPDPRGRFPRFWDHAKGNDPDSATRTAPAGTSITAGDHVGTHQGHDLLAHSHTIPYEVENNAIGGGTAGSRLNGTPNANATSGTTPTSGGSETRGINVNIGVIIKLG